MDIASLITSLFIPGLEFNWIDILIILIVIFYAIEGYSLGFLASFRDFMSFVLSFIAGIWFYSSAGRFLVKFFSIPQGFANAIGFAVAVLSEIIFNLVLKSLAESLVVAGKNRPKLNNRVFKNVNSFLGIVPGILSGLLLLSFILSLIISLPFSVFLKHSISNSKIGNALVSNTQGFAKSWSNVFGGAINDTLSFLTVEPKSNESINLNFKAKNISIDYQSEQKMFKMVNDERAGYGLTQLSFSEELAKVARAHCQDMFIRGYFSHYTPEGISPFDRMLQASINFNYAGENLALAPNVDLAMKGLMQSPGHRANILSQNFNKIGIGVIDGGIYGQMYCQEFTD